MQLHNIFSKFELNEISTSKDFLLVQNEGNGEVKSKIKYYNLYKKLIEELIYVFDYASDWVYNDFIKRNDIEG